jgi:hypothetical protein
MNIDRFKQYAFTELEDDIQDKICKDLYAINLEDEWWDPIYITSKTLLPVLDLPLILRKLTAFQKKWN